VEVLNYSQTFCRSYFENNFEAVLALGACRVVSDCCIGDKTALRVRDGIAL